MLKGFFPNWKAASSSRGRHVGFLLIGVGLTFTPFLVLLFADELVRAFTGRDVPSPVVLPAGTQIREAPRLTRIIGAPSGGAAAVTIGRTILVPHVRLAERPPGARAHLRLLPGDTLVLDAETWRQVIEHERVHVVQRERYGRLYLPVYVFWYLRRGYLDHPLEKEAHLGRREQSAR